MSKNGKPKYSKKRKQEALNVVDLWQGDIHAASRETGIEEETLFSWVEERAAEVSVQPRRVRVYSDEEIAQVQALVEAADGDTHKVARETGIPESTLRGWVNGDIKRAQIDEVAKLRSEKRNCLADAFEDLAWRLVGEAQKPERITQATYGQVTTGAGIAVDKCQLLRGQPTQITENKANVEAVAAELRKKYPLVEMPPEEIVVELEAAAQGKVN